MKLYIKTDKLFSLVMGITVLLIFSACSSDENSVYPEQTEQTNAPFTIRIVAAAFEPVPGTRANNTNQPYTTTFSSGDNAGLIAINKEGNPVEEYNNIQLNYNGSEWSFAGGETEAYYNPDYTYIAYFPYSAEATGLASLEAIRQAFPPELDQSDLTRYTASDFIAAEGTWNSDDKTLYFDMKHLHTLLTLPATYNTNYTFRDQKGSFSKPVLQASVTVGGKVYKTLHWAYNSLEQYRVIIPSSESENCELTARLKIDSSDGEKSYTLSVDNAELAMNSYYEWTFNGFDIGDYTELGLIRMGDYLCRENDGWCIVPQEMPDVAGSDCFGVVFYVGLHEQDDQDGYTLTGFKDGKFHGYAVALTDINEGDDDRLCWAKDGGDSMNAGTSSSESDWKGYSNQEAIKNFVQSSKGWEWKYFEAAYYCSLYGTKESKHDWQQNYLAPTNTSGWFLPSAGQLNSICILNRDNASLLKNQIEKLKYLDDAHIKWFVNTAGYCYWSSSEKNDGNTYAVDLYNGSVSNFPKYFTGAVRAVCAF